MLHEWVIDNPIILWEFESLFVGNVQVMRSAFRLIQTISFQWTRPPCEDDKLWSDEDTPEKGRKKHKKLFNKATTFSLLSENGPDLYAPSSI
ncbi:hypothetical protein M405DRAFT_805872, partial [Rhizopogon salebrosus TDB-379]